MDGDTLGLLLQGVAHVTPQSVVMLAIAGVLLYLGIARDYEPLLLVPIGAGMPAREPAAVAARRGRRHAARALRHGHPQRALPAADLHRHRRADGLRPAARESADGAAGRRRPVRHLPHAAARARVRLQPAGGGVDRHHRRDRRSDVDLRLRHPRAAPAGADHRGGVQLHGAGADHPAADHARADHAEGTPHPDAVQPAHDQPPHAHPVPHRRHRSSSARWCRSPRR